MNYRHSYHAGNFADVVKHVTLLALLKAFARKETGFCYFDTHAGRGSYDLLAVDAQKNCEFVLGINKIIQQVNPPPLIQDYVNYVNQFNAQGEIRYYPGSPWLAKQCLRAQDSMILTELHPEEYLHLKKLFRNERQIAIHQQNGYPSLKAFLPPKLKRGLILIDPPFEDENEFSHILQGLSVGLQRFATGVYAVWYPLKNQQLLSQFYRGLEQINNLEYLALEFSIYPNDVAMQLNGCGMVIINPPWQIEQALRETLSWLWQHLSVANKGGVVLFSSLTKH